MRKFNKSDSKQVLEELKALDTLRKKKVGDDPEVHSFYNDLEVLKEAPLQLLITDVEVNTWGTEYITMTIHILNVENESYEQRYKLNVIYSYITNSILFTTQYTTMPVYDRKYFEKYVYKEINLEYKENSIGAKVLQCKNFYDTKNIMHYTIVLYITKTIKYAETL